MNASNWFKFTAGIAALASIATVVAPAAPAHAAPFSGGSLVVERIGNGTTTLSSTAFQISVLEVTTAGSLTQTIILPSGTSDPQTDSGSASSDGYLNTYGGFVSVPGYNNAAGTAGVASLNSKVNSTLDATGNVINRTLFPVGGPSGTTPGTPAGVSPFSGNNYRSSIATSGSTFYATGHSSGSPVTGGAWYFDGTAFTQVSSTATGQVTNLRNVEIYNNQLFFSTGSGTTRGVYSIGSGLPTTSGQTATSFINMGTSAEAYGFVLFDTNNDSTLDLAYVADDRTTSTAGGINRFNFSGGAWSQTGSAFRFDTSSGLLTTGTAAAGGSLVSIRGLTGSYDAATSTATLFATTTGTSNNSLISFLDTGSLSTSTTFNTLQSAGTNFVFRGVDVSPVAVPEPSTYAIAAMATLGMADLIRRRRRAGNLDG
ncbi:MAG: hypothetical protein DWI04_05435 [Planctomycetota bacterium]|nr:MAG: hypothetical protein DWI04_05435 [Planctomycetota bacterium]